jgi:hypothetical protein
MNPDIARLRAQIEKDRAYRIRQAREAARRERERAEYLRQFQPHPQQWHQEVR